MSTTCTVVISVCLELLWGYLDTKNYNRIMMILNDKTHGKKTIYWLLNVLDKYNIPVTWATVGGLFLEKDEIIDVLRRKKSTRIVEGNSKAILDSLYGKDIVEEILSSRISHELGYHTFTHTVLKGSSYDVAELEIREGVRIAKKRFGVKMKSFVFPKNEIEYIDLIKKYGFTVFRGKNMWKSKKIGIGGKFIQIISAERVNIIDFNNIKCLPTSMLFDNPFPSPLLIATRGMRRGKGCIFHISLHPESFLDYGLNLRLQFELFLRYISRMHRRGMLDIMTMNQVVEVVGNEDS